MTLLIIGSILIVLGFALFVFNKLHGDDKLISPDFPFFSFHRILFIAAIILFLSGIALIVLQFVL